MLSLHHFSKNLFWSTDLLGLLVPCERFRTKTGCKVDLGLRKSNLCDRVAQAPVIRLKISVPV